MPLGSGKPPIQPAEFSTITPASTTTITSNGTTTTTSTPQGKKKKKKNNAATGASAAGTRAVASQFLAFYFRAPIKAFFRSRVDYMGYVRAINPLLRANPRARWSWATSTPGLLAHAIRTHGWRFLPQQVLPPMLANVTVGAILYTTYLQSLGAIYPPSAEGAARVNPPPGLGSVFAAGMLAGTVQSVVAAPLDALQVRFRTSDMLEGRYRDMLHYARDKLREIGPRGVAAGWGLSFAKDSVGFGLFFATFEGIKSQGFYEFVTRYYGTFKPILTDGDTFIVDDMTRRATIKPHFAMEPGFILGAGVAASVMQQCMLHPVQKIQEVHYGRLETLDYAAKLEHPKKKMLRIYYRAYQKTFEQCKVLATRAGGWRTWLFRDLVMNTLRQVPSTSAGLIVFELVRRRWATDADVVMIRKDEYDILLS